MVKRALLLALLAVGVRASVSRSDDLAWLDKLNVVWNSPSRDSFGSMPLGNGDVGANVWVEPSGDLLFYVSKVDAFDAGHALRKLGRVRLQFHPALSTNRFEQALVLRDGAIGIRAGDMRLRVWVDANSPIVRVTGTSPTPVQATVSFEPLRACAEQADQSDRLAWGYRNTSSVWIERVRSQNTPAFAARVADPLMNRTSGCRLSGEGFVRAGQRALQCAGTKNIDLTVRVASSRTATLPEWFAELEQPVRSDGKAHVQWWRNFWGRSHIIVSGCGAENVHLDQCRFTQYPQGSRAYEGHQEVPAAVNAFQLTQKYALERFCEAAAGRGVVPAPFNGSIFTMDMPAGVVECGGTKSGPTSADSRDWGNLPFMWQNTRHPFWAMAARGDYDTLRPGMQFVRDGLDICRDHCRKDFGFDGAYILEASLWGHVGVWDLGGLPGHLRFHQLATIELPAIMCEYYEHTRDRKFLDEVLLPCADDFIAYYANRFPQRDARGKMLMAGVGCVETYQGVDNPCTEIGGLKFVLTKLLSFDLDAARRARWAKLLGEMPGVPTRRICGLDLLAVGERYEPGRVDCETPELYTIYPFRQAWLGTPERLAMARQSFHVRNISLDGTADSQSVETGGWQSAPVQAAYLGLPREAARLVSINYNDQFVFWNDNVDPGKPWPSRPRARFPAFWETKMDYTPDNDHGATSANALQSLLLQSDGQKIYLLPAWPEDWDVTFKLHATGNTTVECEYRDGRVRSLKVRPRARRADVVDLSTPENRIRTLVGVACADRNYLFGLPPMLDALPRPGPVTGPWLQKYGESLAGARAGPWPGCLFRGNVIYQHQLKGPLPLPDIPAKLVKKTYLTSELEPPDTILKLEYDQPVEPFARRVPSKDSLTGGRAETAVEFGQPRTFARLEVALDLPSHRRGESLALKLQARQADGSWRTVHAGRMYGNLYSRPFPPVTAPAVRLKVEGTVRRFDLFPEGK